jgi:hypothetical protein
MFAPLFLNFTCSDDDDYVMDEHADGDDVHVGEGLYIVNAFQDSRSNGIPIVPDPTGTNDEGTAGTVYLFDDAPLQKKTAIDVSGFLGFTQGTCTRTQNLLNGMDGKLYCQLTYEFIDNFGTR